MAVAAIQAPQVHLRAMTIRHLRSNLGEGAIRITRKQSTVTMALSPSSGGRRFIIAASKSPNEALDSNAEDHRDTSLTSQEDLNFLLKLGAGSFAAAAIIKYGSIVVPEITRPNITQALIMITTPVLVAVLILIKESRVRQ